MSGYAAGGAFRAAVNLPSSLHDLWDRYMFKLYYYSLSYDPRDLLQTLPVERPVVDRLAAGIDAARAALINSTVTRAAAGDEAKPTFGTAWAGFMVHMQNGLRPALEIAMRTGLGGPMRLALLGLAAIIIGDALLGGGHIRDSLSHLIASFNSESAKTVHAATAMPAARQRKKNMPQADYRPEIFRLYAQPSFS